VIQNNSFEESFRISFVETKTRCIYLQFKNKLPIEFDEIAMIYEKFIWKGLFGHSAQDKPFRLENNKYIATRAANRRLFSSLAWPAGQVRNFIDGPGQAKK
jgi:hypothetical protein